MLELDSLWIVKIGGSVISTERDQGHLDCTLLRTIAGSLDRLSQSHPLIVVHGTGYVSKEFARANKILEGRIDVHRRSVAANCLRMLRGVHFAVLEAMVDAGIPTIPFSPLTFCEQREEQIEWVRPQFLALALRKGFVPLLHGDLILDPQGHFIVCSSDILVERLVKQFPAERVLFASDVPGVYLRDPKCFPDEHPIDDLSPQMLDLLASQPDVANDVSGAMPAKLKTIRRIADGFVECYIFDGRSPSAWDALVNLNSPLGTRIAGRRSIDPRRSCCEVSNRPVGDI